ncbi:hypothetical protein [Marinobacter vinifirmus]|uniref:Uncharacterized protein n=1 Tax=Marinobacter vinifirmus TaxID=355591 RepID=A0A558B8H6_9GAMM|nr:hypothetical protein [Marinobacter vinifirmus]TVT32816.1 MAG: hypothetical protein FHK81_10585 [Marinobacter vinifirmus]
MKATAAFVGALLGCSHAGAAVFEFHGSARSLENNTLIYKEQHTVSGTCESGVFVPEQHRVDYLRDAEDTPFASKQLAYRQSTRLPAVDFHQPEFNERLQISYPEANTLDITWQKPSSETAMFELRFGSKLVVDAGFDQFVRANWAAVTSGQSVEFDFLAPTRGDYYGFVLEPGPKNRVDADIVVQIRPTSLMLRVLVDPIVLGYNRQGALTHYLGLTNIRKNADANHTAAINYQVIRYPECELTD